MKKNNQYYTNRHSCFLLQYHLVLVTKYRKKVFNNDMETYLTSFIESMMKKNDCNLMEINYHKDHVHILFEAPVTLNLPNSRSYFICTVSEHTTQIVQEYIRNQGK